MGASVTIFSIPKAFRGHIGLIQRNAVGSWSRLSGSEVILFGDDEGVADAASRFGARYVPDIERNRFGTPLVSDAFRRAEEISGAPLLCYANADIILLDDMVAIEEKVGLSRFLLVGKRWDLDVGEELPLDLRDFDQYIRGRIRSEGRPHPPTGSDYFVFPKGLVAEMPPFAVGRPGWDNWLIFYARRLGVPVVDVSAAVTVIHQDHEYDHVTGGGGPEGWGGPEAEENRRLAGGDQALFTLYDVSHILTERGLKRPLGWPYLERRVLRAFPFLRPVGRPFVRAARRLRGTARQPLS